jgi:hypothetical protein
MITVEYIEPHTLALMWALFELHFIYLVILLLCACVGHIVIDVTPFNPSPSTPQGVEIVERAKRVSPSLIAAPARVPLADPVLTAS